MPWTGPPGLRIRDELNAFRVGRIYSIERPPKVTDDPVARDVREMKNISNQTFKISILCVLLASGGADSVASEDRVRAESRGSDCIWIRTIRDYTTLDDRNLLIRSSGKKAYWVTLLHPTFEMRSAMGIGFSSRDGYLCPYGGDGIVFDGFSREKVSIRSISELSAEETEQLLVRFGKKDGHEPPPPAPQPVQGAEVEELG